MSKSNKYGEREGEFIKNMVVDAGFFNMKSQREKNIFVDMLVIEVNKRFHEGRNFRSWVSVVGKIHTIKKQNGFQCAMGGHKTHVSKSSLLSALAITIPIEKKHESKQFYKVEEAMKSLAEAVVALASRESELITINEKLELENNDLKTMLRDLKDVREAIDKYRSTSKSISILR
jgi:hypothetical protein